MAGYHQVTAELVKEGTALYNKENIHFRTKNVEKSC